MPGRFQNNRRTPFHSNVYAKAANGDAMGVASTQSFRQRQDMERNRQVVGRYGSSYVAYGNDHMRREARGRSNSFYEQDSANEERRAAARAENIKRPVVMPGKPGASRLQIPPRGPSFTEPPARGYNPYQ